MIGRLTGVVEAAGEDRLLISVGGVGYEVMAGARTLRTLTVGEQAVLHVHTRMSDSVIRLYGFASGVERAWFTGLQSVPGVGAKAALAVLDVLAADDLADAISIGDVAAVQQARGIGKTIAQRIVAEFEGKPLPSDGFVLQSRAESTSAAPGRYAGVVSALTNLGYAPVEAAKAVQAAVALDTADEADEAELIRQALQVLAKAQV